MNAVFGLRLLCDRLERGSCQFSRILGGTAPEDVELRSVEVVFWRGETIGSERGSDVPILAPRSMRKTFTHSTMAAPELSMQLSMDCASMG